jgi:hypothetical protein
MKKEQMESSLEIIQAAIEEEATIDCPSCVLEKLTKLVNLLGLSAEIYAHSEMLYNKRLAELVLAPAYKTLNATDKKMLFAGLLAEEIMIHSKAERLNKGLVHAIEGLRSMLSFIKEELKKSDYA